MILADFHIHSTWSDGKLSIPELVDLYGRQGFGAIAVTDHVCESKTFLGRAAQYLGHTLTPQTFHLYAAELERERERAWDQYRMRLLSGFEYSKKTVRNSRSAHILAVGVTPWEMADLEVEELSAGIRDRGGLAVAAHPVSTRKWEKQTYYLWDRREQLAKHFDAWEVASGPHLFKEVLGSGLPILANSDLHHPRQLESWKTVLDCENHPEAILQAIRQQRVSFKFFVPSLEKMKKRDPGPNSLEIESFSEGLMPFIPVMVRSI